MSSYAAEFDLLWLLAAYCLAWRQTLLPPLSELFGIHSVAFGGIHEYVIALRGPQISRIQQAEFQQQLQSRSSSYVHGAWPEVPAAPQIFSASTLWRFATVELDRKASA